MADTQLLAQLEERESFLTTVGERVLFATRKHPYILFLRLLTTSTLTLFFALSSFLLFHSVVQNQLLVIASLLTILALTSAMYCKLTIDWYCHLYAVTNHKILEVCLTPLFSDRINDILLDQVRVTEVDVNRNGLLNELLDIGDITITFDRPTHQQEFVFSGIKNSEQAGNYLSDILADYYRNRRQDTIWFREKRETDGHRRFRFTEEIFPGKALGYN